MVWHNQRPETPLVAGRELTILFAARFDGICMSVNQLCSRHAGATGNSHKALGGKGSGLFTERNEWSVGPQFCTVRLATRKRTTGLLRGICCLWNEMNGLMAFACDVSLSAVQVIHMQVRRPSSHKALGER